MIISNFSVEKMDKNDPRYPDADSMKRVDGTIVEFSDIYLCVCTADDGQVFESPFYITSPILVGPPVYDMTPAVVAKILKMFAEAVSLIGEAKAA